MTLYNSLSDVAIARMTLTIDGLALKHEIADDIAFDSSPLWGGLLSAQIMANARKKMTIIPREVTT
jgi:hypothetical protein